ncbi:MAG: 16S rRNA (adenine(1518)-N(6)/adenine(1519)-N(6))-dimethyltransferase RsmA [Bacteroidales bacterium]
MGQHFLTDRNIAERITELLKAHGSDVIIEIGPGKGILTQFLKERKDKELILIEIDNESVDYLEDVYPELKGSIISGDFLKEDISKLGRQISIIGNFPYNISSQIFFKVLENVDIVNEVTGMLQKEVALRLASGPGSKQYGILSVLLQTWYDISIEFHVKPGSFYPPPEVNSSVIRLTRNQRKELPCSRKKYKSIIKTAFNQRRKIMGNSLKSILVNLDGEIPYLSKRPEQLSVEEFIELCLAIENTNLKK